MVTLGDYLIVSGILFVIGFAGVMLRRNLIVILMSLEVMLNAANLSLVAFSRFRVGATGLPDYNAQVLVFFIITVAAAEVRSEEHTSELQSRSDLVCRLLLEKKKVQISSI